MSSENLPGSSFKPCISVVVPCYNAERWVAECIQSCLDQTYQPIEIIVVDDGSTDQSQRIILNLSRSSHVSIRFIEGSHKGACAARNRGLAAATGDYVQFLDADDLMCSRKIELQAIASMHNPDAVPCGPWLWLQPSNGEWLTELPRQHMSNSGDLIHEWLEGRFLAAHSFLWPRRLIIELGGWDESLSSFQDGDLFIRAVLNDIPFVFVPEAVAYYRTGSNFSSVSSMRTMDSLNSRIRVLDKVQAALENRGDLQKYRAGLAKSHYALARAFSLDQPDEARNCFKRFLELSPDGRVPGGFANHLATRLLGVVKKEKLAHKLQALRRVAGADVAAERNQEYSAMV